MKAINIVLETNGDNSEFVDIEDDFGNSIKIGTAMFPDSKNTWCIRITAEDIQNVVDR